MRPVSYLGAGCLVITDNRGYGLSVRQSEATAFQGNSVSANAKGAVSVRTSPGNTLRRNSIFNHKSLAIVLSDGGNRALLRPLLAAVNGNSVSGTAYPNCLIEVFSDDDDEGRVYEGSTRANSTGVFSFTAPRAIARANVTATAADSEGNTSPFSAPLAAR